MPLPLKYLNVNWVNGMKITREHLAGQDRANDDKIKDVASAFLHPYCFGLLPVWPGESYSFRADFKVDNQRFLKASLFDLRAFTPGGARLEIAGSPNPQEWQVDLTRETEAAKKEENGWYYILLTVDLFAREPCGQPDEEEEPPRFPFTAPSFRMQVIPVKELSASALLPYSLCTGKMLIRPDKTEILDDYLPPCMALSSHNRLMLFHSKVEKFYNQMEINLLSIIGKIREKNQDSSLALSVLALAQSLLDYLSVNNLAVKWLLPGQPPLFLFENIACFARNLRNTIDSNTAAQKEELLNYFTNWSELKQGDFEKLLVYCINFEYNHLEIADSIDQFSEFVQIMATLFSKLESLAYIGKKKETNIFVKEQTVKRSFLAD